MTPIDGPTGVDFASAIADRDLVDEALRHLDPEWRAVVVMHYFLGMPLPEVAGMLGIPLGTAKSRLHRSILAMRIAVGADETPLASSDPGRAARMMPSDRFDRRLPAILDEISQPRTPDYFDDLLGQTARTRQRPAWTLLERWLPMVDVTRQPAFARQVPWRPIAVLTLIVLLLVASLAFVIGSQHTVPAPFGPARQRSGRICEGRRHLHGRSRHRQCPGHRHRPRDRPAADLLARRKAVRLRTEGG